MISSLRRAVTTATISVALWASILAVEVAGRAPSVSGTAKGLLAFVVVSVLLSSVAVPVGGGILTLAALRPDLPHPDRRAQVLLAVLLGVTLIVLGLKWLPWVMNPHGNPPGLTSGDSGQARGATTSRRATL